MWGEIYNRLAELILENRTTLVFVNTRRLAERVSHNLTERLGPTWSCRIMAACRVNYGWTPSSG